MDEAKVINLAVRRRARALAAVSAPAEVAAPHLERAALGLFEAVTAALQDGADPREVDRLVARMDRLFGHMDGT